MSEERETGKIKIESDVVSMIAGLSAVETEGIAGMSGGFTEDIAKRVSGKNLSKGVKVEVGETEAAIDLRVSVKYGYNLQEVARELQINVKESVESMTGLEVIEVNVYIESVEFKKEKAEVKTEDELPRVR